MTVLCILCILASIMSVSLCTLYAYRKGVCDGRCMQAINEYFPDEVKNKRGRII